MAEGAGAAALAAVLAHPQRFTGRTVQVVVSGGNVDMRMLSSVIMRRSRRPRPPARCAITDQPGLLAKVARLIGEVAGNIVEVHHGRLLPPLGQVGELEIIVETRGPGHVREIVNRLMATGYTVSVLDAAEGAGSI